MTAIVAGELTRGSLIILRSKLIEDAAQDYAWRRDPELATFDAARPYHGSYYEYLAIFRDELSNPSSYRRTFAVEDFEGRHLGNVMYYNVDQGRHELEIGVTIGLKDFWGKGYGTDLIATFIGFIFETMRIDRVHLKTLDWNVRAQKCFERVGFQRYSASRRGEYNFVLMEIQRSEFMAADQVAEDSEDSV